MKARARRRKNLKKHTIKHRLVASSIHNLWISDEVLEPSPEMKEQTQ